jgi:hypothetical protein
MNVYLTKLAADFYRQPSCLLGERSPNLKHFCGINMTLFISKGLGMDTPTLEIQSTALDQTP